MNAPRMIAAQVPDRGQMFYLVDDALDFIPEVKAFLDWKAATRRAPNTIKAYCSRLAWFYRFVSQRNLSVLTCVGYLAYPFKNQEVHTFYKKPLRHLLMHTV